jgi:hypothetical protein
LFDLWFTWIREILPDYLQRQLGRMSVSEGSIAAMSSGSVVMTGCPRSLAQMATLTSTMSAVRPLLVADYGQDSAQVSNLDKQAARLGSEP